MQTSPVSFGRAIKVNSTPTVANIIAQAANVSTPVTSLEKFAKSIFNDTYLPNGKAKVVVFEPDDVYIYSGKDAEEQSEISKNVKQKISENLSLVEQLPERTTRDKRRAQVGLENRRMLHFAIFQMKKPVEDGVNGKANSILDVSSRIVKNGFFGSYDVIDEISYESKSATKQEKFEYKA